MIFIADLTPPPALCPYVNGSAVLKFGDKIIKKNKMSAISRNLVGIWISRNLELLARVRVLY